MSLDLTVSESDAPKTARANPRPFLFLVLECERPRAGGMRFTLANLDWVSIGRGPVRGFDRKTDARGRGLELRVPDSFLSGTHARLQREAGGWVLEDGPSRNGSFVGGRKVQRVPLRDGDLIELGHTFFVLREAMSAPDAVAGDLDPVGWSGLRGLTTLIPEQAGKLAALSQLAPSGVPVVLLGETGTGKEVLARAIHTLSGRSGAFIAVNCGALPDTLVESQLFGHVKGSFSGALRDEPGFVRASDKGLLFLDEIGDLPRTAQATLLRVLQEHEVVPVGSTRPLKVDLRVVAATHRPIDQLTQTGEFRADLYARLSGATYVLPPLRERREDLGLLCAAVLRDLAAAGNAKANDVTLSIEAGRALLRHEWPLNVRELYQALSVSSVLADGGQIRAEHLPASITSPSASPARVGAPVGAAAQVHNEEKMDDEQLRARLIALLQLHKGNVAEVGRAMDKARMQIHRWMKRLDIDPNRFRDGG